MLGLIDSQISPLSKILGNPLSSLGGALGFGSSPAPFKLDKNSGLYKVNGAKGGKQFLGGTFDPNSGTFTLNNPKGRDFSQQQVAIDAYLAGTGPRPEGKQFSRLLKAIDSSGYMSGMNSPGAQQAAAAPWSTQAFAPMMPALMQQTAAFARPEAMSFLQAMTGQGQQTAQAAQGMGMPNMGNPFLAAGMRAGNYMPSGPIKPGPDASPFLGLNRFAGPFGNGGGPIAPVPGMNT